MLQVAVLEFIWGYTCFFLEHQDLIVLLVNHAGSDSQSEYNKTNGLPGSPSSIETPGLRGP